VFLSDLLIMSKGGGVRQGRVAKMGGLILLLATFFSLLGCCMEWLQTDYTQPVAVTLAKQWDAEYFYDTAKVHQGDSGVSGVAGMAEKFAGDQTDVPTDNKDSRWQKVEPISGDLTPLFEPDPDSSENKSVSTIKIDRGSDGPGSQYLRTGQFAVNGRTDNETGYMHDGTFDKNGLDLTLDVTTQEVEIDSSLWKYCKRAQGGYATITSSIINGSDGILAPSMPTFTVDCRLVVDMEDGQLKSRLLAAEVFSILASFFGALSVFAAFNENGKFSGKCGKIPSLVIAFIATLCGIIAIGCVSCSGETMFADGECAFPYASLEDNELAAEYPGIGMISEVFACLFFLIGGISSFLGSKIDKTRSTLG
jgi:hypothetical protein